MQAHIVISGFVQGVGFRHFVLKTAQSLGLTGWVRNTENEKVEALFQGDRGKIEKAIEACRKGPFIAEVENVEVQWEESDEELEDFEIVV